MKRYFYTYSLLFLLVCVGSCSSGGSDPDPDLEEEQVINQSSRGSAKVTEVTASGEENRYTFRVTIESVETGCNQYVDWWEVIDIDGKLLYRKVLLHSHVDEQPFTRNGGPVMIEASRFVYVRAHMNDTGYSSEVAIGSPATGFSTDILSGEFAKELEDSQPLPASCAF